MSEATSEELEQVIDWCLDRQDRGETYRAMTYEEGVIAALEWVKDTEGYPSPAEE